MRYLPLPMPSHTTHLHVWRRFLVGPTTRVGPDWRHREEGRDHKPNARQNRWSGSV